MGAGEEVGVDVDDFRRIILCVEEGCGEEKKRADDKGFHAVSVSGVVIFCGDLCGVEEGEEDAAEGGLAAGWVVPLLESVNASSDASGAQGDSGYVFGKRDVDWKRNGLSDRTSVFCLW